MIFGAILELGAEVRSTPVPDNPAHPDILCSQGQTRKLADATQIIDWPPSKAPGKTTSVE